MAGDDRIDEMNKKLDEIKRDVSHIQGDVRMQTRLHKDLNHSELVDQTLEGLDTNTKKKIWYHADGRKTSQELAEAADVRPETVSRNTPDMLRSGVLERIEDGNEVYYLKSEITVGIGIEQILEKELDV